MGARADGVEMTVLQTVSEPEAPENPGRRGQLGHTWALRGVDFEDGVTTRCFECVACGAARYE